MKICDTRLSCCRRHASRDETLIVAFPFDRFASASLRVSALKLMVAPLGTSSVSGGDPFISSSLYSNGSDSSCAVSFLWRLLRLELDDSAIIDTDVDE